MDTTTVPIRCFCSGLLRQRFSSVVLDLTSLSEKAMLDHVRQLPALIDAERLAHGVPHWVVVDEAHLSTELATSTSTTPLLQALGRGLCLITYRPERLSEHLRLSVDLTVTVLGAPIRLPRGIGAARRQPCRLRACPEPLAARGDFSRWIAGSLQDATLADVVAGVEQDLVARNATSVERARSALGCAVNTRYGTGEPAPDGADAAS